jgi:hypothetical protein
MNEVQPYSINFTRTLERRNILNELVTYRLTIDDAETGILMININEAVFKSVVSGKSFVVKKRFWRNQWYHESGKRFFAGAEGDLYRYVFADGEKYVLIVGVDYHPHRTINFIKATSFTHFVLFSFHFSYKNHLLELNEEKMMTGTIETSVDEIQHIAGLLLFMERAIQTADQTD